MNEKNMRDGWGQYLSPEQKIFNESVMKLLGIYMPGTCEIEMMVGRNVKAKLTIQGGPLTRDVIEDTMAHLAFYKKYFPEEAGGDGRLTSPEQIIEAMGQCLASHMEKQRLPEPPHD